ncbi:hypothetical protein KR009_005878 [Drosophila setifemur]|nr:hypothetical protein KR009_005878 [Drosophila setifemur]
MAHNTTLPRKPKFVRMEPPPMFLPNQSNEPAPPKEKIQKLSGCRDIQSQRRVKSNKLQQGVEPPSGNSKVLVHDLNRLEVDQHGNLPQASKNANRSVGVGVTAAGSQKFVSKLSLSNQTSKSTRSTLVPHKESKDIKEFKAHKESKEPREHREPKEPKKHKDSNEPKETKVKGESKSLSHRHTTSRSKSYFDKYLKFAFDLSTPEGVKQLEAHFFPNQPSEQNPLSTGNSSQRQE